MNILIWTPRKSVDHETNDRVMVHSDGRRADGRRSGYRAPLRQIVGSPGGRAAVEITVNKSYVVSAQAGYLARPITEAPETRIYFITHGYRAFPVPRVRTVVRGERASRSIVNRTTGLWSIWMVASLILTGSTSGLTFIWTWRPEVAVSRGSNGLSKVAQWALIRPRWTLPSTNGRKRT